MLAHGKKKYCRLKKVILKIHRGPVAIATADFSILAYFANLEAKNAENMYFLRTVLSNGLRKFYKTTLSSQSLILGISKMRTFISIIFSYV